jgi:hypothetical protein
MLHCDRFVPNVGLAEYKSAFSLRRFIRPSPQGPSFFNLTIIRIIVAKEAGTASVAAKWIAAEERPHPLDQAPAMRAVSYSFPTLGAHNSTAVVLNLLLCLVLGSHIGGDEYSDHLVLES